MINCKKNISLVFTLFVFFQPPLIAYPEVLIDEEKHYSQAQCLEHKLRGNVFKRTVQYPDATIIELYDNLGRCRQISYDNQKKSISFKDTFQYQDNKTVSKREKGAGKISVKFNKLMQLTEFIDDSSMNVVSIGKKYDKKGNLAAETIVFQNPDLNIVRVLGYRGLLIRVVTKDKEGKELTRKIIKYNSKEQPELIEVRGEKRQKLYNIITEFDKNGLPVLSNRIGKGEFGKKKTLRTVKIIRDQFGNPTRIEVTDNEDKISETYSIEINYEYW